MIEFVKTQPGALGNKKALTPFSEVRAFDLQLLYLTLFRCFFQRYSHRVERTPDEDDPHNEHRKSDIGSVVRGTGFLRVYRHLDRDFGREQAEQSRELDDGVHGYG